MYAGLNRVAVLEGYRGTLSGSGLGRLADTTASTDDLNTMMDNTIEQLKAAVLVLKAKVALLSTSSDQANATNSALATMDTIINRLDTTSRADVLAGNEDINKWLAAAQEVANGIDAQDKLWGNSGLYSNIEATIKDAYNKLGQPPGGVPWWLWGVGALAVLGGLLFLTRPSIRVTSLKGYRRGKRRASRR